MTVKTIKEIVKEHVLYVLRISNGHRKLTAERLGIGRATLYRYIDAWKIKHK